MYPVAKKKSADDFSSLADGAPTELRVPPLAPIGQFDSEVLWPDLRHWPIRSRTQLLSSSSPQVQQNWKYTLKQMALKIAVNPIQINE